MRILASIYTVHVRTTRHKVRSIYLPLSCKPLQSCPVTPPAENICLCIYMLLKNINIWVLLSSCGRSKFSACSSTIKASIKCTNCCLTSNSVVSSLHFRAGSCNKKGHSHPSTPVAVTEMNACANECFVSNKKKHTKCHNIENTW